MKIFITLCLLATALSLENSLRGVLRSPGQTLKLYGDFKAKEHLMFGGSEDRLRFVLFRNNAEFVAQANEDADSEAVFGLNFLSALTEDEKKQYLGLNVTGHSPNSLSVSSSDDLDVADTQLWTADGSVTSVKNQGSCGSCWTFGAVGGLETRYKNIAGKLRNFAEQEYLDCVYEGKRNGCNGGWPDDCYTYSQKQGGRLASTADYKYAQKDGKCLGKNKADAMIAAKITGSVSVGRSEAANIAALASGSLSVAFEVTNYFQQYRSGIIKDKTCTGRPNHAVTAVGYTPQFVLVKNSWGTAWGESGFVKFARNHGNCDLFNYSSYPKLTATKVDDDKASDEATDYKPNGDDDVDPKPTSAPACKDKKRRCGTTKCHRAAYAAKCQKTCGKCDSEDKCPSGTTRCDDGVCRHEHMC